MKRRLLSILLVCVMLVGVLSLPTLATDGNDDVTVVTAVPVSELPAENDDIIFADEPLFSTSSTNNFKIGTTYYASLSAAITAAGSSTKTIIMTAEDYTLESSVTIPSNVTLLLPYGGTSVNTNTAAHPYANSAVSESGSGSWSKPEDGNTVHKLTVKAGVKITVEGKLVLGGCYTAISGDLAGQTDGSHSDIVLEDGSELIVNSGGILSSVGYISGDGKITVNNGGTVYEPFVITDYNGGSYTAVSFKTNEISPFNSYAMLNIQAPMTMYSGAKLYGYCDLITSKLFGDGTQHNQTTALVVGPSSALLNLSSGKIDFSYVADKNIESHFGIGRTEIRINGTAALGSLSLTVSGETVETSTVLFPLPYNFSVIQKTEGLYIPNPLKMMPGSEVKIEEGASLHVESELLVYDGMAYREYSGKAYPSGTQLSNAGFSERARLIVNGAMYIKQKATFAGIVEATTGTGIIDISSNVNLSATTTEGGCKNDPYMFWSLSSTNRADYELTARVANFHKPGTFLDLEAGKQYCSTSNENAAELSAYSYTKYSAQNTAVSQTEQYDDKEIIVGEWTSDHGFFVDENYEETIPDDKRRIVARTDGNEATCEDSGSYTEIVKCAVCEEILSSKEVPVSALGHDYQNNVFTWGENYTSATVTSSQCTRCGDTGGSTAVDCNITHAWNENALEFTATSQSGPNCEETKAIIFEVSNGTMTITDEAGQAKMQILVAAYNGKKMAGCKDVSGFTSGEAIALGFSGQTYKVFILDKTSNLALYDCLTIG